jgi:alkyldihydroxyacetonephosphate synthase
VLGSEGRLGVLTEATLRVSPLPDHEEWHAVFFPEWGRALEAVRQIVQTRLPLSLLRLSNAAETEAALTLGGRSRRVRWFEQILAWRGAGAGKCLLLLALSGDRRVAVAGRRAALELAHSAKGVHVGGFPAARWRRDRFKLPYLRNGLWEHGYALDTLETAAPWSAVDRLLENVEGALRQGLEAMGERVFTFSHVSHVYPGGASLYVTYLFRLAPDPEDTLERWGALKAAASRAIMAGGGTISHHHGVGTDHREHLEREKGELGLSALRGVTRAFDPAGIMNPGKLLVECA